MVLSAIITCYHRPGQDMPSLEECVGEPLETLKQIASYAPTGMHCPCIEAQVHKPLPHITFGTVCSGTLPVLALFDPVLH